MALWIECAGGTQWAILRCTGLSWAQAAPMTGASKAADASPKATDSVRNDRIPVSSLVPHGGAGAIPPGRPLLAISTRRRSHRGLWLHIYEAEKQQVCPACPF